MLASKLHLKPGMRVAVVNAPAGFSLRAAGVTAGKAFARDLDLVLLFATMQKTVTVLALLWFVTKRRAPAGSTATLQGPGPAAKGEPPTSVSAPVPASTV